MFVLIAAQCENVHPRLTEEHREEAGRAPRQGQLLLQLSECPPVKVLVCVIQTVSVGQDSVSRSVRSNHNTGLQYTGGS